MLGAHLRAERSSSPSASWAGVDTERNVSATISRPLSASSTAADGPDTPTHATLTCGSPTDFESPPRPNASACDCCSTDTPAAAGVSR